MKSGGPKIFILTILLMGAAAGLGWLIFSQFQERAGASKRDKALRPVPVEYSGYSAGS